MATNSQNQLELSLTKIKFIDKGKHQFFSYLFAVISSIVLFSIIIIIIIRSISIGKSTKISNAYFYLGLLFLPCSIAILFAINFRLEFKENYPKNFCSILAFQSLFTISIAFLTNNVLPENIYSACYLAFFSFLSISLVGYFRLLDLSSTTYSYLLANACLMILSTMYLFFSYFFEININILSLTSTFLILMLIHSYIFFETNNLLEKDLINLPIVKESENYSKFKTIVKTITLLFANIINYACICKFNKSVKIEKNSDQVIGRSNDQATDRLSDQATGGSSKIGNNVESKIESRPSSLLNLDPLKSSYQVNKSSITFPLDLKSSYQSNKSINFPLDLKSSYQSIKSSTNFPLENKSKSNFDKYFI